MLPTDDSGGGGGPNWWAAMPNPDDPGGAGPRTRGALLASTPALVDGFALRIFGAPAR